MRHRRSALSAGFVLLVTVAIGGSGSPAGAIFPAPVFSEASGCGGVVMLRYVPLFGPGFTTVSASDTQTEQVTVTVSGLEAAPYLEFTSTTGNPGTGTISIRQGVGEFFAVLVASAQMTTVNVTFTATDSLPPQTSSSCLKTIRVGVL